MTPRVSVVATVYNGEPYFDRAAPSIRELTEHFRDDIAETSVLIGRSLDHWL